MEPRVACICDEGDGVHNVAMHFGEAGDILAKQEWIRAVECCCAAEVFPSILPPSSFADLKGGRRLISFVNHHDALCGRENQVFDLIENFWRQVMDFVDEAVHDNC